MDTTVRSPPVDPGGRLESELAALGGGRPEDKQQELEAALAQVEYLKKKVRYMQSVGTIFRQRVGILFREKFRQRDYAVSGADHAEFDAAFRNALAEVGAPSPPGPESAQGAVNQGELQLRIESLTRENERLHRQLEQAARAPVQGLDPALQYERDLKERDDRLQQLEIEKREATDECKRLALLLHDMGPTKETDLQRAHRLCELMREKARLQDEKAKLSAENENLKKEKNTAVERHVESLNRLSEEKEKLTRELAALKRSSDNVAIPGGLDHQAFALTATGVSGNVMEEEREKAHRLEMAHLREEKERVELELKDAKRKLVQQEDDVQRCENIIKQNNALKARLAKVQKDAHAQKLDKTTEQTRMQSNIEELIVEIAQQRSELGRKDSQVQELGADKQRLMHDVSRMNTVLERYKTKVLNLEREQISRSKAEQILTREHRRETETLCASLDTRESKIQQLHGSFVDISEQLQLQVQKVSRTGHELDLVSKENMTLKSRLQQLDVLLEERKHFSSLLSEVQGRMEMAVEELKRAQSTQELASEVQSLEHRIAGLTALEGQLKQKDDLIAVRDDEVQRLKLKLAMFERNVNNISAVFLQFPHSLEDMETLIIEVEEYRKMAGRSAELDERVRLRQLELRARRKQRQQQGAQKALHAGVMGHLDAATAALLARTADASDSDASSQPPQLHLSSSQVKPQLATPRAASDPMPHSSPPVLRMDY